MTSPFDPRGSPSLLAISRGVDARVRLFCFPCAGGGASAYRSWTGRFPAQVQVLSVRLPGRESRVDEPAFTHMVPLVAAVSESLVPYLRNPYVFFGHSMGALIAFEVARYLLRLGYAGPNLLIAACKSAPQVPRVQGTSYDAEDAQLIDELNQLGGVPRELLEDRDLMEMFLKTFRADLQVLSTYTFESGEPLDCPIIAISGRDDRDVRESDMVAWRIQTKADFSWSTVPGGHFVLFDSPHLAIPTVLRSIQRYAYTP